MLKKHKEISQSYQKMEKPKTTYKAESIQQLNDLSIARNLFDFKDLQERIKKRGDLKKVSHKFNIQWQTLRSAINEAKILSIFPKILKSKAGPLSAFKIKKELKIFAKQYDIDKLEVRELYKAIREWRKKVEENPGLLLTSLQQDIIVGSTLGDGYIRQREENCNFRVGHSRLQEKYLLWKYSILKEFTLSGPKWNIRNINNHLVKTLELATATHKVFNYYRKLFYKKNIKKVTREVLNLLTSRSLAIWLCDDGCYAKKQGYIILCTNSYSLKEHKIMKRYFEEIWNLSPTVGFRDNKYYYLRFKQDDTKKLVEIVRPFILESMRYKIGEKNV